MGNSLARIISNQLYPLIKDKFFPVIDSNLETKEAKKIKKHLTQLFKDMQEAILPIGFEYELQPGSAIGSYADKINLLSFMISLRVKFEMWIDKGFPDYLKAKLSFQTRMGLTEWSTAVSVLV